MVRLMNTTGAALGTYLVTQSNRSQGRTSREIVEAAIAGGVDIVQIREKHRSARERLDLARELRPLTARNGVALVVNDRVDIAGAADADGVHLGDDDLPVAAARKQLGDEALIGRSVSSVAGAREAAAAGADYLGVGAVFHTDSKNVTDEKQAIGLDVVRAIDSAVDLPFVGIGGVTPENAADIVAAGADGVAVISAITAAEDPQAATRGLTDAVADGYRGRSRRNEGQSDTGQGDHT
jgi:thiamine-phosphate pyrophosphorylase